MLFLAVKNTQNTLQGNVSWRRRGWVALWGVAIQAGSPTKHSPGSPRSPLYHDGGNHPEPSYRAPVRTPGAPGSSPGPILLGGKLRLQEAE